MRTSLGLAQTLTAELVSARSSSATNGITKASRRFSCGTWSMRDLAEHLAFTRTPDPANATAYIGSENRGGEAGAARVGRSKFAH